MSTELGRPITVVSPRTGELLELSAPDEDLAGWLADVREHESLLREAKNLVQRELLRRMDRSAKWTVRVPKFKLTGTSPKPEETWDGAVLRERLHDLVDDGELTVEAVDAAVETVISFKVRKAGVNALRAAGGRAAAIVDELAIATEKERRVSVSRA